MPKYIVSDYPKKVILYVSDDEIKLEQRLTYFLGHDEDAYILETKETLNEVSKKYKINQFTEFN